MFCFLGLLIRYNITMINMALNIFDKYNNDNILVLFILNILNINSDINSNKILSKISYITFILLFS